MQHKRHCCSLNEDIFRLSVLFASDVAPFRKEINRPSTRIRFMDAREHCNHKKIIYQNTKHFEIT